MFFKRFKENEKMVFQLLNMECMSLGAMCLRCVLSGEISSAQREGFLSHMKVINELLEEILEVHDFS